MSSVIESPQVIDESVIKPGEHHPAADHALAWFKEYQMLHPIDWLMMKESIASTALAGNRLAQICFGTINRIDNDLPISDRYLLGLCWFLRESLEKKGDKNE